MFTSIDTQELPVISHSQIITGNGGARYTLDTIISPNRYYSVNVLINSSGNSQHKLPQQNTSKFTLNMITVILVVFSTCQPLMIL